VIMVIFCSAERFGHVTDGAAVLDCRHVLGDYLMDFSLDNSR